jgi:hypothetical protein
LLHPEQTNINSDLTNQRLETSNLCKSSVAGIKRFDSETGPFLLLAPAIPMDTSGGDNDLGLLSNLASRGDKDWARLLELFKVTPVLLFISYI